LNKVVNFIPPQLDSFTPPLTVYNFSNAETIEDSGYQPQMIYLG